MVNFVISPIREYFNASTKGLSILYIVYPHVFWQPKGIFRNDIGVQRPRFQ